MSVGGEVERRVDGRFRRLIADPLTMRIVLPVVTTTVVATALSAFLIFGKFDRSLSEFEQSRFTFALGNIGAVFVRDLDLGLDLEQIGNAQAVLERQASMNPDIAALALFNARGQVLAHVGVKPLGEIPASWLARNEASGSRLWSVASKDAQIVGLRLSNSFDQTVGGVLLGYSGGLHQELADRMARDLALGAVGVAGLAVLISFLVSVLLISRVHRTLGKLNAQLQSGDEAAQQLRQVAHSALDELEAANAKVAAMIEPGERNATAHQP
ncbi:MAG: hypothetical protein ACM31L_10445 [Actinomycetota bacterium]